MTILETLSPFFQAPNDIFDKGFNRYELVVCLYLLRCRNRFPGNDEISEKCDIGKRRVKEAISSLRDKGIIVSVDSPDYGGIQHE